MSHFARNLQVKNSLGFGGSSQASGVEQGNTAADVDTACTARGTARDCFKARAMHDANALQVEMLPLTERQGSELSRPGATVCRTHQACLKA